MAQQDIHNGEQAIATAEWERRMQLADASGLSDSQWTPAGQINKISLDEFSVWRELLSESASAAPSWVKAAPVQASAQAAQQTPSKSKPRTRHEWERIISAADASSQTDAAWCRGNGISASTLSNWRRRLSMPNSKADSIAPEWAKAGPEAQRAPSQQITVAIGPFAIELTSGFDEELLKKAARSLLELC